MATGPSNLRHLFGESPTPEIDVSSVIRRSRARRAPRVLGAGGLAVLALGTVAYAGFTGLSGFSAGSASDAGGSPMSAESSDQGLSWATEESASRDGDALASGCGSPVVQNPSAESWLVLSVAFPAVGEVGAASIDGTVTMTNTGAGTVSGYTAASPTVTLSSDGVVVWNSTAPAVEVVTEIDLDPGESIEFAASIEPVLCGTGLGTDGVFPSDPLEAPAGYYEVSAVISVQDGAGESVVSGPPQSLRLE